MRELSDDDAKKKTNVPQSEEKERGREERGIEKERERLREDDVRIRIKQITEKNEKLRRCARVDRTKECLTRGMKCEWIGRTLLIDRLIFHSVESGELCVNELTEEARECSRLRWP